MAIIIFILILSILVLVHEFGHFIAAKRNGIRVEEFGLGLPPKIFSRQYGETMYSLNLLPFGGFVKLTGEDLGEGTGNKKEGGQVEEVQIEEVKTEITDIEGQTLVIEEKSVEVVVETTGGDSSGAGLAALAAAQDPKSFSVKTPWQRFGVLFAGVAMNAVLAIALFYIFLISNGFKTFQIPLFFNYRFKFGEITELQTVVVDVQKGLAAEKAGISVGEAVLSIDGVPVNDVYGVRNQLVGKQDKEVEVKLLDLKNQANPQTTVVKLKPSLDSEGNPILGVYLSKTVSIGYQKPLEKVFAGFLHSYNILAYSVTSFAKIIGLSVETRDITPVSQSVAGPVGIYNVIHAILKYGGRGVLLTLLDYIAIMSLSLAFINVLPFPALDGGRILFVLIEGISGKRVNPVWEANIHKIGMVLLLGLIVLITIKDIAL